MDNEDKLERVQLYRLFAALLMQGPDVDLLSEYGDIFQVEIEETPHEIGEDFASLFSAPGRRLFPYESAYAYAGDVGITADRVSREVEAFYASTGLVIDEETNLSPDHVSTELSFMSYLIENGLAEYQSFFLKNHLMNWIPIFCEEMISHAQTAFYKNVAGLLREFISSEYKMLE